MRSAAERVGRASHNSGNPLEITFAGVAGVYCARLMTSPVRAAQGSAPRQTAHSPPGANRLRAKSQGHALRVTARVCAIPLRAVHRACLCAGVQPLATSSSAGGVLRCAALRGSFTGAPFRDRAQPFGVQVEITFADVASVSRPFAPRPTRCAVCSSSMAKCYVCHRRRPYKRNCGRRSMSPTTAGRNITFVGSLGRSILASGDNASNPAGAPSPLAARHLHRLPTRSPLAGWPSALTLDPMCARFRNRRFLFGRGAGRAHTSTLSHCGGYHPAGVRASCGRARPATQAAEQGDFRRSDVAGGLAQAARGLPAAACGWGRAFTGCAGAVRFQRKKTKFNIVKG